MATLLALVKGWKTILLMQALVVAKIIGDIDTPEGLDLGTLKNVLLIEGAAAFRSGLTTTANIVSAAITTAANTAAGK